MTFSQYTYFTAPKPANVQLVLRISGLAEMASLVNRAKTMKYPALVVEDAPDMNLNLQDRTFEDQQHTFYVLNYAAANDDAKREAAYTGALAIGKLLLINMELPYGSVVDKSNVYAFRVGPLGDGAYGYGFSYGVSEG
jgi:hypothetical protein